MEGDEALLDMARELVGARSPSGREGPALRVAEALLRDAGLVARRQPVGGPDRFNIFASRGKPRAVLTTHVDTVPGEVPARVEGEVLHGRGACDAKGALAAMIAASAAAVERGLQDFGVLVVVGEETTSDGAMAADLALSRREIAWASEAAVFGEPTQNRWATAHPGVLVLTARARGRAAHSAHPEEGDSAVHRLLEFLGEVRGTEWPEDDLLGPTRLNVGRLSGGSAANVVAEEAEAEIMFRTGADPDDIGHRLRELAEGRVEIEVGCASSAVHFEVPRNALDRAGPVSFSTDAPFLRHLGAPYLCGPGSIRHAHTDAERVTLPELAEARDAYLAWLEERSER